MRVLCSGVDTLEASFTGELCPALLEALKVMKGQAQEHDAPQPFDIGQYPFAVSPSGLKPWRYVMKGDDLHLRLSGSKHVPSVFVRLLSIGFASMGHETAWDLGRTRAESCGQRIGHSGLSRIDLYADVQGFEPTAEVMAGMVTPAVKRNLWFSGARLETCQYGKNEIVCRVYDKTEELASSGKEWMRRVWAQTDGYDATQPVWRIEYQLRREFLRELDPPVVTVEDAFARLDDLWRTSLAWAELRVPEGENSSRWDVHPAWLELRELAPQGVRVPRVHADSCIESFAAIVPQTVGLLVSGGAALGMRDLDSVLSVFGREAQRYLERRGANFADLVDKRSLRRLGSS